MTSAGGLRRRTQGATPRPVTGSYALRVAKHARNSKTFRTKGWAR